MNSLRIATMAALLVAGALNAQARIITNGPTLAGASENRVTGILSIDLSGAAASQGK